MHGQDQLQIFEQTIPVLNHNENRNDKIFIFLKDENIQNLSSALSSSVQNLPNVQIIAMGVSNIEKYNPEYKKASESKNEGEILDTTAHSTCKILNSEVSIHACMTFKDPIISKLLHLDIAQPPYTLPEKYFVNCQSDPDDTLELDKWSHVVEVKPNVALRGIVIRGK